MPTIADYLKFANLQMAAEALYTFNATPPGTNLTPGDKRVGVIDPAWLTDGNLHASKFTAAEATKFAQQWTVVEHISNTTTGFSGTLFKDKDTGELALRFRSTEFLDDHARDNTATNVLEIKEKGFAFGQLSDMEAWYADLSKQGGPLAGKQVSVTGYSLGGHLATAFNLLHPGAAQQVVIFNGAGIGKIGTATNTLAGTQAKLREMIDRFRGLRTEGDTSGLASRLATAAGRDAYQALKTALADTSGVPSGGGLVDIVNGMASNASNEPRSGDNLADYRLLWEAVARIKAVYEAAHRAPTLPSGSNEGPSKPANIPDQAIAGEALDYQQFPKSRRWRHGDSTATPGNDMTWRRAA